MGPRPVDETGIGGRGRNRILFGRLLETFFCTNIRVPIFFVAVAVAVVVDGVVPSSLSIWCIYFFPPWRCSLVIPIRMNSIQIKFEVLDRVSLSLSTVQVQTVLDSIIHPPQFQLKRFNRIIPRSGFCFHSHWFHPPNGWLLIQLIRIIHPKIIWCGHTEGLERKRRRKKRRKREKRRVKEGGRWRVCVCVRVYRPKSDTIKLFCWIGLVMGGRCLSGPTGN